MIEDTNHDESPVVRARGCAGCGGLYLIEDGPYVWPRTRKDDRLMKRWIIGAICLLAAIGVAAFSFYLVKNQPAELSPTASLLLDILLAAFSIAGSVIITLIISGNASHKTWLPAAESACQSLLSVAASVGRLIKAQRSACDSNSWIAQYCTSSNAPLIEKSLTDRCNEMERHLQSVQDQVGTSLQTWLLFIGQHCTGTECQAIAGRLEDRRSQFGSIAGISPITTEIFGVHYSDRRVTRIDHPESEEAEPDQTATATDTRG